MTESQICNEARKLSGMARSVFLEKTCGDDIELRRRVEASLAINPSQDATIDLPKTDGNSPAIADPNATHSFTAENITIKEHPVQHIGPYKLIQPIGEGGMGTVWMAEQEKPVKRRVALKVIRSGIGSKEILARFEAERQALALMNHPNIARILDAGATNDGQPYFVMELVQGTPLTKYCDNNRLSIDDRLKLFGEVCSGVQHAHQKGIIHRDLKPGNIIVGMQDGNAVPKIIDFGLAKAMETTPRLTDQSLFTGIGQILGTLKYMSPEQASLDAIDIDTRTDIYALGVILYELLTGTTPLDGDSLKGLAALKILELIRDKEPVKPSSKLGSSTDNLKSTITAQRQTDIVRLNRILTGDLDWIVMKALDKDRTRRYESASGFAADIQRYLNSEPVIARPPSVNYRVRKFVRKNRTGVIAAGLVVVALLAGIGGVSWGLARALIAEKDAVNARDSESKRANSERLAKEAEIVASDKMKASLKQVESANEILADIFADIDVWTVRGSDETLESVLAKRLLKAASLLDGELVGSAKAVAGLQLRLGQSLIGLGFAEDAIPLLERSLKTRSDILGVEDADTFASLCNVALAYESAGRLAESIPLFEQAFEFAKSKFGLNDPNTISCMGNLAMGYQSIGRSDLAEPLLEQQVGLSGSILGADHESTLTSNVNLASVYFDLGKKKQAILIMEPIMEQFTAKFGPYHAKTLTCMSHLSTAYWGIGEYDKALELNKQAFEFSKATFGLAHPETLTHMQNLAGAYVQAQRLDLALPLYEQVLESSKIKLGASHNSTLERMSALGGLYLQLGDADKALELRKEHLEITTAKFGNSHVFTVVSKSSLARAYGQIDRQDLSLPLMEQIVPIYKETPGIQDYQIAVIELGYFTDQLALAKKIGDRIKAVENDLIDIGRRDEQLREITELESWVRIRYSSDPVLMSRSLGQVAKLLLRCEAWVLAEPILREVHEIRKATAPNEWLTHNSSSALGGVLVKIGNPEVAKPLLVSGYIGLKENIKAIPAEIRSERLVEALDRLIELAKATDNPEDLKKWEAERTNLHLKTEN